VCVCVCVCFCVYVCISTIFVWSSVASRVLQGGSLVIVCMCVCTVDVCLCVCAEQGRLNWALLGCHYEQTVLHLVLCATLLSGSACVQRVPFMTSLFYNLLHICIQMSSFPFIPSKHMYIHAHTHIHTTHTHTQIHTRTHTRTKIVNRVKLTHLLLARSVLNYSKMVQCALRQTPRPVRKTKVYVLTWPTSTI
jgi:hypothetical protein